MKWLLLTFLGVAAASQVPAWTADKEYTFHYTTSVLSGIPQLGRQHAGLKLAAIIKAQRFPDQTIRIQLEDAKFQNYNEEVEWDEMSPWSPRREELRDLVPASAKVHLEAPFKVVTNEGLVEKIQVEDAEPEFITNIKRAVVTHLFALSKTKLTLEREFLPFVKRMETSVVGECETEYTIARLPEYLAREFEQREQIPKQELCEGKEYFEVLKAKNLKVCKQRPVYMHMYGANAVSDGSMGSTAPFAEEASITKAVICGTPDAFHLRKVTNEQKVLVSPSGKFENEQKIHVTAATSLHLRSVEQKAHEIPDVKAPKARGSLMYEFPREENLTSRSSMKSALPARRSDSRSEAEIPEEELWYQPQAPKPDMVSAPNAFFPRVKPVEELKEQIARAFLRIVENARKSPESIREDVAGTATVVSHELVKLSLEEIKGLWTKVESIVPVDLKEIARYAFLDLVSMAGTNPCVKYIVEAVKRREVAGEPAAWIAANAIRTVKTPTEELLKELIELLKHEAVQADRNMVSTVALSLTHLVHKACIHETSSVYDYPVKTFGLFCDQKSAVITRELIPFLAEKLNSAQPTEINKMITYINALGNLGHDGAAVHLLRAVEGRPSLDAHVRSVAVYQLIKVAATNPSLYRPVILALVMNEAESEEVRMAAVTVLPYTRPLSSQLNTLAVRTWFEPSKQVSAYITTTLRTLAHLPAHSRLAMMIVAEEAQQAYRMAKPTNTGIQMSHNIMIAQFLDTLKAAVNFKLQYVTSHESAFPKNIFLKDEVVTKSHAAKIFETAINLQGAEYLINKMYDAYDAIRMPQQEQQRMEAQQNFIKNIVHVQARRMRKPEAHVTVKVMGLQRIFSLDHQMVEELIEKVTKESMEALKKHNSLSKDFLKMIDLNGNLAIIPTEVGLPVYVAHRTPLVISGRAAVKAKLENMRNGEAALTIEPVVNYKQITHAGALCPFTKKFLAVGVDTAVHVAMPLKAEVTVKEGHYTVAVSIPRDEESQKEKPVFHLRVKPYTAALDLTAPALVPINKAAEAKVIKSRDQQIQRKEYHLGQALGLDLKLKIETEQHHVDLAEFVQGLYQHRPLTLLTLPLPLRTVRDHSVSVILNPRESHTKAASIAFSFGYAQKIESSREPEVTTYTRMSIPENVERECRQEAERWSGEEREVKREECEREKLAIEEKERCMREQSRQSRPSSEIEAHCNKKSVQYRQMHTGYKSCRKSLKSIMKSISNAAKAVSVHVQAALHGENYVAERLVQTQITISQDRSQGQKKENQMKVKVAVKTPHAQLPYEVDFHAHRMIERPASQWDKDAILREDISSKIAIKAQYGRQKEQQHVVKVDIQAERSAEQKEFAKRSEAWRRCDADLAKNQQLSVSCKEARHHAGSLDEIQMEVQVPKMIVRNPMASTIAHMAQAYFIPYLSIEESSFSRQTADHEFFRIHSKIAPTGKAVTVSIAANREKTVLRNVRVAPALEGLVPFCVMKSFPIHLIKKVTHHGAPSTCAVEGNKVETFDKVVYDYELNDCEHVLVRDCTEAPKVLVTVKKTPALHIVRAVIDDNKYELEVVKATRGSRSQAAKVKVNDQIKQGLQQGKFKIFEDRDNHITMYEDGVVEIHSVKYGMIIRADGITTQVVTFQQRLRNLACGLCGDLNDEKTADVRSAKQCVMSSPKLAAYSFMVEDRKCAGIPTADKARFVKESEQCVRKEVIPAKVYDIFTDMHHSSKRMQPSLQHVVQRRGLEICISKRQIKICGIDAKPAEIVPREMPFFCMPANSEGKTLKRMALRGERIQKAEKLPTAFTASVFEPRRC